MFLLFRLVRSALFIFNVFLQHTNLNTHYNSQVASLAKYYDIQSPFFMICIALNC